MKQKKAIHAATTILAACLFVVVSGIARADDFSDELASIQHEWARINYEVTDKSQKVDAFESLAARAESFAAANPGRAEPLVWEGIVLSTAAGAKGGLGAMKLAKQAREKLEAAEKVDPQALNGSVYTSLGTLYAKVPGWPIGFGDDEKARAYLEKAVALNPDGIDPNYFYGEYLYDQGEYSQALAHLEKALSAPPRPGREDADAGRRAEVESLLAKVRSKAS
jgi:tetratricopeptide (TPR) repeat protein